MPEKTILKEGETLSDIELENRKWANRRRMSYASMAGLMVMMLLILIDNPLVSIARITAGEGIIGWVAIGFTSIVIAYFGFNTLQSTMKKG